MKTEEQIKDEIKKHKDWLKENQSYENKNDVLLHKCIIDCLEWVLK